MGLERRVQDLQLWQTARKEMERSQIASLLRNAALGPTQHPEGMHSYFLPQLLHCQESLDNEKVGRPKGWVVAKLYSLGTCRFKLHLGIRGLRKGKGQDAGIYKAPIPSCPWQLICSLT